MKYTTDKIESLVKSQVRFWRYDKTEDVYVNKWTISSHYNFGFFPNGSYKPEYDTKEQAEKEFRVHLQSL